MQQRLAVLVLIAAGTGRVASQTPCDRIQVSEQYMWTDNLGWVGQVNCYWIDRQQYNCDDFAQNLTSLSDPTTNGIYSCMNSTTSPYRCIKNDTSLSDCSWPPPSPPPLPPPPSPPPSPPPAPPLPRRRPALAAAATAAAHAATLAITATAARPAHATPWLPGAGPAAAVAAH